MSCSMRIFFLVAGCFLSAVPVFGANFASVTEVTPLPAEVADAFNELATMTLSGTARPATAAEIAADANLAGAQIYSLFVNTVDPEDILSLSVEMQAVNGTFYNPSIGSDDGPTDPVIVAAFANLGADSYITTPSADSSPVGDSLTITGGGTGRSRVFDTTDDPFTSFKWAQITVVPDANCDIEFYVSGAVQLVDVNPEGLPHRNAFRVLLAGSAVPEPASMGLMLAACLCGLGFFRRKS